MWTMHSMVGGPRASDSFVSVYELRRGDRVGDR